MSHTLLKFILPFIAQAASIDSVVGQAHCASRAANDECLVVEKNSLSDVASWLQVSQKIDVRDAKTNMKMQGAQALGMEAEVCSTPVNDCADCPAVDDCQSCWYRSTTAPCMPMVGGNAKQCVLSRSLGKAHCTNTWRPGWTPCMGGNHCPSDSPGAKVVAGEADDNGDEVDGAPDPPQTPPIQRSQGPKKETTKQMLDGGKQNFQMCKDLCDLKTGGRPKGGGKAKARREYDALFKRCLDLVHEKRKRHAEQTGVVVTRQDIMPSDNFK